MSWKASSDNDAVAGYRVYKYRGDTALAPANAELVAAMDVERPEFKDSSADTTAAHYRVVAIDGAGNQSGQSSAVIHPGGCAPD